MVPLLLLASLLPTLPLAAAAWTPAPATTGVCKYSDKFLHFTSTSQIPIFIDNVCAAIMPACAYPSRLDGDTFCTQSVDWPLTESKSDTQVADVMSTLGVGLGSGWGVRFSVTPASQPANSAGVFWTVQDCNGYLTYLMSGCRGGQQGFGVGRLTIGGDESLNGTVVETSIVAV